MRINEILNEGLLSNVAKAVKRAVVGWGMFDKLTPAELKKKISELSDSQLRLLAKSPNDSAMKSSPRDLQMKLIQREILRRQAQLKEGSDLQESERWNYYTDKYGNKWKNNDEYRVNLTTGEEFNLDGTPVWSGKKRKTEKTRYYYEVSFAQKEKAKSYGMRWDPEKKKWYSEDPDIGSFKRA